MTSSPETKNSQGTLAETQVAVKTKLDELQVLAIKLLCLTYQELEPMLKTSGAVLDSVTTDALGMDYSFNFEGYIHYITGAGVTSQDLTTMSDATKTLLTKLFSEFKEDEQPFEGTAFMMGFTASSIDRSLLSCTLKPLLEQVDALETILAEKTPVDTPEVAAAAAAYLVGANVPYATLDATTQEAALATALTVAAAHPDQMFAFIAGLNVRV
ncbi:Hypothetical protein POVN_LOCUS343 [uncultured virus]|nr:Hypothetical protein POVN_LOCUS343 [uncultured virus]